jgi:hypothetical protein
LTLATTALTIAEQRYLEILEARIKNGLKTFWQVGEALVEIKRRKLYRQYCNTFEEYCDKQWDFSSRRAEQLMKSAQIVEDIKAALPADSVETQKANHGSHLVDIKNGKEPVPPAEPESGSVPEPDPAITQALSNMSERQARELANVPREQRGQVFSQAVRTAPDGKLTAVHIKATAAASQKDVISDYIEPRVNKPKPAPKPRKNEALEREEERIILSLQTIRCQKLYCRVAESFEDYLDGLIGRITSPNE